MGPQAQTGLKTAIRKLTSDLDELDAIAKKELAHPSTRIQGKIRRQLVKECRTSLRLIDLGYRFGR